MRVTQLSNQVSSVCSGTSDWIKIGGHFRIDSDREVNTREVAGFLDQNFWILRKGNGVEVYDAEETFVLVLQRHPIAQRAEVIPQMNIAGGLSAAEDSFHFSMRR